MKQKARPNDLSTSAVNPEFQPNKKEEENPSACHNYIDQTHTPDERKRPSIQNRVRKLTLTLIACAIMGFAGYKVAGKNVLQSSSRAPKTFATYTNKSFPISEPDVDSIAFAQSLDQSDSHAIAQPIEEIEIFQPAEHTEIVEVTQSNEPNELSEPQPQNQNDIQTIQQLKSLLANRNEQIEKMKLALEKQKRSTALQKRERSQGQNLEKQLATSQQQLDETTAANRQLKEQLQQLQKQQGDTLTKLTKQQQDHLALSQRFNSGQQHLQQAQKELLNQTSENGRLAKTLNKLQAELAVTTAHLNAKEQALEKLAHQTKNLNNQKTYYSELITQKDQDLTQLNTKIQQVYEDQYRLQETLIERDDLIANLLAKIKKLKKISAERESEMYARAVKQLSSIKPTSLASKQSVDSSVEEELQSYLNTAPVVPQPQKIHKKTEVSTTQKTSKAKLNTLTKQIAEREVKNTPAPTPSKNKPKDDFDFLKEASETPKKPSKKSPKNNSELVGDSDASVNSNSAQTKHPKFLKQKDPDYNHNPIYKDKSSSSSRHKQATQIRPIQPTQTKKSNPAKDGYLAEQKASVEENSLARLSRELETERKKIEEMEKNLQETLSRYQKTQ